MFRNSGVALAVGLMAAMIVGSGCGRDRGKDVVARVGHVDITRADLNERLQELPPYSRQQFSSPEGIIDLLERMLEEEVLYQAARDAGYGDHPDVERTVEAVRRRAMIQAFYKEGIEADVVVSEDDIVAYYDEHDEQFQRRARVKFRHIMSNTRSEAQAAKQRVLGGEDFASVARELSIDASTKEAGGLVGSVPVGDGLLRLGMDADFITGLFEWKVGETTDPVRSEKGWHIVRLEEKQEAGVRPLAEVRDTIVRSLKPAETREHYEQVYEDLKARYGAAIDERAFRGQPRTEEELFTLAQETDDPLERLNYYSELAFNYPDGEHAAEAQFMIGFIYAEELKSYDAARNAFERTIEKYPDSELGESARWMLENMGKDNPVFEDSEPLVPE